MAQTLKQARVNLTFSQNGSKSDKTVSASCRCHGIHLAGVQTSGQRGAKSLVFAKFAKFAENPLKTVHPLPETGAGSRKVQKSLNFCTFLDIRHPRQARSLVPGQITGFLLKMAENHQKWLKPPNG